MMSHFAKYKKERENKDVLETAHGFVVWFKMNDDVVYIEDIYVDLAHRQEGLAADLADTVGRLAKDLGCTKMMGSVNSLMNGASTSLMVLLSYGMKLHLVEGHMIYFMKEI